MFEEVKAFYEGKLSKTAEDKLMENIDFQEWWSGAMMVGYAEEVLAEDQSEKQENDAWLEMIDTEALFTQIDTYQKQPKVFVFRPKLLVGLAASLLLVSCISLAYLLNTPSPSPLSPSPLSQRQITLPGIINSQGSDGKKQTRGMKQHNNVAQSLPPAQIKPPHKPRQSKMSEAEKIEIESLEEELLAVNSYRASTPPPKVKVTQQWVKGKPSIRLEAKGSEQSGYMITVVDSAQVLKDDQEILMSFGKGKWTYDFFAGKPGKTYYYKLADEEELLRVGKFRVMQKPARKQ